VGGVGEPVRRGGLRRRAGRGRGRALEGRGGDPLSSERSETAAGTVDRVLVERMVANEADMAYRRRVITILEWLDPRDGDRILDGGCGRGFYLNFLRAVCRAELWGVEFDAEIAAKAARAHAGRPGLHVVRGNLERLPFPPPP